MAPGAVEAQHRFGVPAAVTIAQAIDESGWGQSELAARDHNLFGIKGSGPAGSVPLPTQEYVNGQPVSTSASFRVYHNVAESIDDHGRLLARSGYYQQAMSDRTDPDKFAAALTGVYATDPNYGANLISLMRRYGLYRYGMSGEGQPGRGSGGRNPAARRSRGFPAPRRRRPLRRRLPARAPPRRARDRPCGPGAPAEPAAGQHRPDAPGQPAAEQHRPDTPRQPAAEQHRPDTPREPAAEQHRPDTPRQPAADIHRQLPARPAAQPPPPSSDSPHPVSTARPRAGVQPRLPAGVQPRLPAGHLQRPAVVQPQRPAAGQPQRQAGSGGQPSADVAGQPPADARRPCGAERVAGGAPFRSRASRYRFPGGPAPGQRAAIHPRYLHPVRVRAPADYGPGPPDRAAFRATLVSTRRYQSQIPRPVLNAFVETAKAPLLAGQTTYQEVAGRRGISWQLLAACDWMQCEARTRRSPVYGERLGAVNGDGTVYVQRSAALGRCADDLVRLSRTVYGLDLTRDDLSVADLANAFAAFRWGGLLKAHDCSAMEFPYSVEGLTSRHVRMRWPRITDPGNGDRPGARFHRRFGAVPILLSLDYPATV